MNGPFPRQFGKYVLLKTLAKGGMGEIYLAAGGEVGGFEKLCVIKKVIAEKADRTKANRFMDEAKVVLRLSHSALVNTFDAGEVGGEFYIAMELVEGKDLREVWNRCVRTRQRIPLDVALHLVREVARALGYVHTYGDLKLVHRDVAPPNILLAYVGDVKLTDFGLARSVLKQEHTAPGVVFGRAAYLAPEQARGEVADARTDIYTLGIVLWELLTGQQFLQLSGLDPVAALALVRHPKVSPPSSRAPWITAALDHVVMRALAPDRERRFQTADELRQALSAVITEAAPTADAARVSEFLHSIYAETIAEERAERERFLKEEIPRFRGGLGMGSRPMPAVAEAAVASAPPAPTAVTSAPRPTSTAAPAAPGIASLMRPGEDAEALVARVTARRTTEARLPGMTARTARGGAREAGRTPPDLSASAATRVDARPPGLASAPARAQDEEGRTERDRHRARREAAFRAINDLVAETAAEVLTRPPVASGPLGAGPARPAVASAPAAPSNDSGIPSLLAAGAASAKVRADAKSSAGPAEPPPDRILGGGVLARYGLDPHVDPRELRRRHVRKLILVTVLAAAGLFGLAKACSGEPAPDSAPSAGAGAEP
jgi:tRNA A-37 threonylcarbamoyl transferase component Bud32